MALVRADCVGFARSIGHRAAKRKGEIGLRRWPADAQATNFAWHAARAAVRMTELNSGSAVHRDIRIAES